MPGRPCIALLTDFGHTDAYVGVMKGVIAGICPDAAMVDLCHDIPPQNVREGALQLLGAYRYFPAGSVFLCVVDPHVGTERFGLAIQAGAYTFVGPDNGLLAWAVDAARDGQIATGRSLDNPAYRLPEVSATFHGRDIFAPAAAHLAAGVPFQEMGTAVDTWETLEFQQPDVSDDETITGAIIHIDRFGNLITNISRSLVDRTRGGRPSGEVRIRYRGHQIDGIAETYADVESGTVAALFGSTGYLELVMNGQSAQQRFDAHMGEHVTVLPP